MPNKILPLPTWQYLLLFSAIVVLSFIDKVQATQFIFSCHVAGLNEFFTYVTHAGDGLVAIPLFLYIGIKKRKLFLPCAGAFLISVLLVFIGKTMVFTGDITLRPYGLLGADALPWLDSVNYHVSRAFPSGHSTAAFGFLLITVTLFKSKALQWFFAVVFFLAAFSRFYIGQHWHTDVMWGAVIAHLTFYLVFRVFHNFQNRLQKSNGDSPAPHTFE